MHQINAIICSNDGFLPGQYPSQRWHIVDWMWIQISSTQNEFQDVRCEMQAFYLDLNLFI